MTAIKPMTKKMLNYLSWEKGAFFHFGIRTFNEGHIDWDMKPMDVSTFNPTELDCEDWIRTIKENGFKYAIMTTKHHDGFALWPSKYTEYNVSRSPWKDGKGDVVREFTDACRKYGIKVGLYYSVSEFAAADLEDRYDDIVIGELTEIMSNYGDLDILWFDGCGSGNHVFDYDRIGKAVSYLQPNAIITAIWGQDMRWIGNEWLLASIDNPNDQKGQEYPGECDGCLTRIRAENYWFYSENNKQYARTVDELVGIYYHTVGNGSNILLNIAPDRRGLIPDDSKMRLNAMTKELNRRFVDGKLPSTEVSESERNGKKYFTIEFDKVQLLDTITVSEDASKGCKVRSFAIAVQQYENSTEIKTFRGYTIGYKKICQFPVIRAKSVSVIIEESTEPDVIINSLTAYYTGGYSGEKPQIAG